MFLEWFSLWSKKGFWSDCYHKKTKQIRTKGDNTSVNHRTDLRSKYVSRILEYKCLASKVYVGTGKDALDIKLRFILISACNVLKLWAFFNDLCGR